MSPTHVVSGILQSAGVLMALWGLVATEHRYRPADSIAQDVSDGSGYFWIHTKRVWYRVRFWLTGQGKTDTTHVPPATWNARMPRVTAAITDRVPDLDPALDTAAQIALLHLWLRATRDSVNRLDQVTSGLRHDLDKQKDEHEKMAEESTRQLQETVSDSMTNGIRFAIFGLLVSAVGSVLGIWA